MPEGPRRPDRRPPARGRARRRRRPAGGGRPLRDAVAAACERWGVEIEGWVDGDRSSVALVRRSDGRPAVAKRSPGGPDGAHEGDALAAWQGRGAVELLARDGDGVLLVERAVPGTPVGDDVELASALRRLWIDPPVGVAWRRFDDVLAGWRSSIERWSPVLGADVVASALSAPVPDPAGWCLLHGDGHHGNVLDGGGRGWLAIDPQPLVGPLAYDLATAVWNGPGGATDVEARLVVLASAAAVDPGELRAATRFRSALSVAWSLDGGEPIDTGVPARALAVARTLATTVLGP